MDDDRNYPCKKNAPSSTLGQQGMAGTNSLLCPTDCDLILLRKNAIGERKAVEFYLCAASQTTGALRQLFLDTAHDEMRHFRQTMALLAKCDHPQAMAFEEQGITLAREDERKYQPNTETNPACNRMEAIKLLTDAIVSELEGINMYQQSYIEACHHDVKDLFCANANDEKLHLAEFWKMLMTYTGEGTAM